jgi:hypothetical protein
MQFWTNPLKDRDTEAQRIKPEEISATRGLGGWRPAIVTGFTDSSHWRRSRQSLEQKAAKETKF